MTLKTTRVRYCITVAILLMVISKTSVNSVIALDEPKGAVVQVIPPTRQKPQLGSIRLRNGLILDGLCSRATTLAPVRSDLGPSERLDQHLEMRMVDQKAREIYLPVRRSEPPVLNNLVWPNLTFKISQKRAGRKALPAGIPDVGRFNENGIAEGKLYRINGTVEDIQVGIVAINELYAEVHCLTYDWQYAIGFDAVPRDVLPGILSKVDGFDEKPFLRLDLIRMLINANRLPEAALLYETVTANFPQLAAGQVNYQQLIREQVARQITSVLEERRDLGQHQLASTAARLHPKNDLTPETIVRVNQLIRFYDETATRIEHIKTALPALVAKIEEPQLREAVTSINRLVSSRINEDTIDRFAAFELIVGIAPDENANNDGVPAEEQLAMAFSGWLMGAENTVKNLSDVVSLFDARQAILDYMDSDTSEVAQRQMLADRVSRMEGVGIERVASIIRNLEAIQRPRIEVPSAGASGRFNIEATPDSMGATGFVPPEYNETRQYPVVVAMHGRFETPESYLTWWQSQAEKHGYIIVAPEWIKPQEDGSSAASGNYDASAETHLRFLSFVRRLKLGLKIDDDRIFIAGQDLGGEVAMDIVTSHPDLFAGVISICGTGRRHLQWTAPNAILLPWYVVVGDSQSDWFDRMGMLAARFFKRDDEMDIDYDMMFIKYPFRGLERYSEEADDVFTWMARHKRDRFPQKVYSRLLRSTDLHWSWVKLSSLPGQFAQLDAPSVATEGTYRPAELNVRRDDKNFIRIKSPSNVSLLLSPEMAGLDVNSPIRIHNGRKTISVDYDPQISHMLEEFYSSGERRRLCHMRVDVP